MELPSPYDKKEITIKLSPDVCEEIVAGLDFSKIVSDRIAEICSDYRDILNASTKELLDKFSNNDLLCIKTCMEACQVNLRIFAYSHTPSELHYFIEEGCRRTEAHETYNIDLGELLDKCKGLTTAQIYALYKWCEDYKCNQSNK